MRPIDRFLTLAGSHVAAAVTGPARIPGQRVAALLGDRVTRRMLVYGGDETYRREGVEVVGLHASAEDS